MNQPPSQQPSTSAQGPSNSPPVTPPVVYPQQNTVFHYPPAPLPPASGEQMLLHALNSLESIDRQIAQSHQTYLRQQAFLTDIQIELDTLWPMRVNIASFCNIAYLSLPAETTAPFRAALHPLLPQQPRAPAPATAENQPSTSQQATASVPQRYFDLDLALD